MPINQNLLIAAPYLQDIFVAKDGTPLANGVVTCYQDLSRTTLKNWYYQSSNSPDSSGNYTFSALPNPLTLSAAGTICDINGVDTIPFFYPYSESDQSVSQPYFITVYDSKGTLQFTRANFPYNRQGSSPAVTQNTLNNLIINNGFWRNIQPNYVNQSNVSFSYTNMNMTSMPLNKWTGLSNLYGIVVAPSQHDNFSMPDIQFLKDNFSGTDAVTFTPFPLSTSLVIPNTVTPEYYINHVCSGAGSSENVRCYQFPIALHLNNLANNPFTVSIQAMNNGGTGNTITLQLLQFTGSGSTSPAPKVIMNTTITLSPIWTTYNLTDIFPSANGLTLSQTEDDAWYLQVQLPLNVTSNINFTKPSLYLTNNVVPANDLLTYDQVDAVISSARTGDIRTSLNSFAPFGWVAANDGTIGTAGSSATTRANNDTWPLYSLLWNAVSNTYAPVTGGRGATAYVDFIANKPITLTRTLSRVLGCAGSGSGLTTWALGQYSSGTENTSVALQTANMAAHTHGYTYITLPAGIGLGSGNTVIPTLSAGVTDTGTGLTNPGAPFNVSNVQPSVFYNVFFKL